MKIEKLYITLSIELPDDAQMPTGIGPQLEAEVEGVAARAIEAHGGRPLGVCATLRREGEA